MVEIANALNFNNKNTSGYERAQKVRALVLTRLDIIIFNDIYIFYIL